MPVAVGFMPTGEQAKIIERFRAGHSFVVEAGAGTGKTRTLAEATKTHPEARMLYLAYNKAIVMDAGGAFPSNVECRTAHSVAFRYIGHQYAHVLNTGSIQGWQIAKSIGVSRWRGDESKLSGPALATLARSTINRWAGSTDLTMGTQHVPVPEGIAKCDVPELRNVALKHAQHLWDRASDPRQQLIRFSHDWYLKLFSLGYRCLCCDWSAIVHSSNPLALPYDAVLFDECQDADPVIRLIFEAQPGVRVAVGDSQQAIYSWRGAVNAIDRFRAAGAPVEMLTQSWRFGDVIAKEANHWLKRLDADLRLVGNSNIESRLGAFDRNDPHAILCRTNTGVVEAVIEAQERGVKVAMVRCDKAVKALIGACERLHSGAQVDHPELMGFPTWADLVHYTEGKDCDNPMLRTLVRLSATYTPSGLRKALHACVDEKEAHTVVSTAHSAKGREWPLVRIAGDFPPPAVTKDNPSGNPKKEDLRLAYVAVTRAKKVLDRSLMQTDMQLDTPPREILTAYRSDVLTRSE